MQNKRMTVTIDLSSVTNQAEFETLFPELNALPHPFVLLTKPDNDRDTGNDTLSGETWAGVLQAVIEHSDKAVLIVGITGLTRIILKLIDHHYDAKKVIVHIEEGGLTTFKGDEEALKRTNTYLENIKRKAENE